MLRSAVLVLLASYVSFNLYCRYFSIAIEEPDKEYDFIIVGGGTTGSVIANRLSENGLFKVLVLEAGLEDGYHPLINIPILNPFNRGRFADWNFSTESVHPYSQLTVNNELLLTRGKGLGGTSLVNFQLYVRGSSHDYDSWELSGAEGWSYKNLLPYFLKSESSQHIDPIDKNYHGTEGPLEVKFQERIGLTEAFIKAAKEMGLSYVDDHNGKDILGVAPVQTTAKKGLRQSASKAYLHTVAHSRRDNLHIVTGAHVTKVMIREGSDGTKRAVGVDFLKNGRKRSVSSRREVILSAGAFGTPQILMLSGIGPKDHLKKHKIEIVANLPGVGSNYQDHLFTPLYFHSNNLSFGDTSSNKEIISSLPGWILKGTGPLGTSGGALANIKLSKVSSESKSPDIQAILLPIQAESFAFKQLAPLFGYREELLECAYEQANEERNGVLFTHSILLVQLHPKSKGTVRLRSNDPFDDPVINPMLFSHPDDMKTMIEGVKWVLNTTATKAMAEKETSHVIIHNLCKDEEPNSEAFYKCVLEASVELFHGCCTAKIGRRGDELAVVDPQLRVYGIEGLRVADTSVWPHQTSGAPQATCFMLGERAADLIKEANSVK